jgi:hypothetical protein
MKPMSLIQQIFQFLFSWRNSSRVEQIAGEAARECQADLWHSVYPRTVNMNPAEIRGYVRAYAVGYLTTQVDCAVSQYHLQPALKKQILGSAIDQLVSLVSHEVLCHVANPRTLAA